MKKDIYQMTKKEFLEIENFYNKKPIYSVIIVPTKNIHDSGFRCMKYILLGKYNTIVGAVAGWSDVVHLDGISGLGKNAKYYKKNMEPSGWSIDCLQKSGLLRLFCGKQLYLDDIICSDFMLYSEESI